MVNFQNRLSVFSLGSQELSMTSLLSTIDLIFRNVDEPSVETAVIIVQRYLDMF